MTATAAFTRREAVGSEREDSRFASWWSSWRVAIRMGRRDVRRHRGRSALIVVMVFLPVVAVIGGVVLISSEQVSSSEQLQLALGGAVGMVRIEGDGTVASNQEFYAQHCQPQCLDSEPPARRATPVPGWSAGHEATALQALTGGAVARVTSSSARAVLGSRRVSVSVLGADVAAHPFLGGRATLLSGRWPSSADEVVVTPVGSGHGLPTTGRVTAIPSPDKADKAATTPTGAVEPRALTVVGTATAFTSDDTGNVQPADLVTLPDALGRVDPATGGTRNFVEPLGVQYLLDRPAPLTSAEVSALNDHGLGVVDERLNAGSSGYPDDPNGGAFSAYTALVAVGLLLLTSLLAGPAFAVSAARQRRTLALTAANGATTAQLRRTMLGQALVLGVLAALLGAAVGLGGSWLLLRWLAQHQPGTWWGPYDVPTAPVAIVVGSAVISSVVAAVLPARGLGRLDVVQVMRGQEMPARLHRGLPVVGALLLLGGTSVMAWGFTYAGNTSQPQALIGITGGVLMLVVGALSVIPAALAGLGRLTRELPVTVRMATRDAARQRGRATPTVAAVMAAAAVLTTVLVVTASSARHDRLAYQPSVPPGTASLSLGDGNVDGALEGLPVPSPSRRWSGVRRRTCGCRRLPT